MADTEQHPSTPNEFHSRFTSPKLHDNPQVGTEMYNGGDGILAFKVFPKAWADGDHHDSTERFDDDDVEEHMITKEDSLQHSINLPPMSPTALSPPPKYIASQVSLYVPLQIA